MNATGGRNIEGTYKSTNNTVRENATRHVGRVIQKRRDFITHVLQDYMWIQSFATASPKNCDCHKAHEAHFPAETPAN